MSFGAPYMASSNIKYFRTLQTEADLESEQGHICPLRRVR